MRRTWWLGGCMVLLGACVGDIGGGGGDTTTPPQSTPTDFACNSDLIPETLPLRRLSRRQYANTVRAVVSWAAPSSASAILDDIAPTLNQLVDDIRIGDDQHFAGLSRLDQTIQQSHIDGAYGVSEGLAAAFTQSDRLEEVVGACAVDDDVSNDESCLDDFIERFGERVLRRPVRDDDLSFYRGPAGSAPHVPEDYADVITMLLNAPHFLYFVEHGTGDGVMVPLDGYEIASRLSYHFWQTMPDEPLLDAARSGALTTEAGYRAEVDRVFHDPRTRDALAEFFGEWLQNTVLEPLDARVGDHVYDTLRGDLLPSATLREEMWSEVTDAALFYATDGEYTFADFVKSDRSFARSEALASIYEVAPWSGEGEPPTMTQPERAGLFTRAAYVASGTLQSRPIIKGVFLRKAILCDSLNPPPPDAPTSVRFEPGMSTREVVEEMTGSGSCAACHETQINGLGFPTENFDPFGRARSSELLFDHSTGEIVEEVAVDTVAEPRVDGESEPVADAHELTDRILASPKLSACFARQYYRFTFGRREDIERDGCALEQLQDAVRDDQPLAEVLRRVALSPQFSNRTFIEEN